jgi:acetyltransferase-like isoleucine patch superfamily enzyme
MSLTARRRAARALGWLTTLPYRSSRRIRIKPGLLGNGRLRIQGPGSVVIESDVNAWSHAEANRLITTTPEAVIRIGAGTRLNGCTLIASERIEVGAGCVLGSCEVRDSDPSPYPARWYRQAPPSPVVLEDNVWVGGQAFIAPGVRVGRNSVVGLHAVVFADVPRDVVVAGNPARIVRRFRSAPDSESAQRG